MDKEQLKEIEHVLEVFEAEVEDQAEQHQSGAENILWAVRGLTTALRYTIRRLNDE